MSHESTSPPAGGHDTLHAVPCRIRAHLAAAARGVVVLALDGLSLECADQTLAHATLTALRSTFPSTSTTAWMTAITGRDVSEHGVVGMIYRAPGATEVTNVVTGESRGFATRWAKPGGRAGPLLQAAPTVFDTARALGARAVVSGAEITSLHGPWARALLHGARRQSAGGDRGGRAAGPGHPPVPPAGPAAVVARAAAAIDGELSAPADTPLLLWAHVNLDDHIHRAGYDGCLRDALHTLDEAASRWADDGWTVLAHADHGQVPVTPRPDLLAAWARLDDPANCRCPAGGAGRVRWLYPRPGREDRLAAQLRSALGDHALVVFSADLPAHGMMTTSPAVLGRIGEIVAVATSPGFPVPDPSAAYEHGSTTDAEVMVPFATWSGTAVCAPPRRGMATTAASTTSLE